MVDTICYKFEKKLFYLITLGIKVLLIEKQLLKHFQKEFSFQLSLLLVHREFRNTRATSDLFVAIFELPLKIRSSSVCAYWRERCGD